MMIKEFKDIIGAQSYSTLLQMLKRITAYLPDEEEWANNFRVRKKS